MSARAVAPRYKLRVVVRRLRDAHSFDRLGPDHGIIYYEVAADHSDLRWYDLLECGHMVPGKGWGRIKGHTARRKCCQCASWGYGRDWRGRDLLAARRNRDESAYLRRRLAQVNEKLDQAQGAFAVEYWGQHARYLETKASR